MHNYITTPIYYVNGLPHVGSALTTISCDVIARYHRLLGEAAWLLTGTDENATKVFEAAQNAGIQPAVFVENLAGSFRSAWTDLHVEFDDFIRTSEPRHVRACQQFFSRLLENGCVYLGSYEGWYSVSDETFYLDDKVKDGFEIETGKPVVRVREENYFFKLSAFAERLLAYYKANPGFLMPEHRENEAIQFIHEGLRDMCITRANKGWGIQTPGDPSRVIYVWFDALINYLAATGWPDDETWHERWPPTLQLMGKEIFVRFHATLWPAMLMALELPLPERIYGHGWWTARGGHGKLGKSTGGLPTPDAFTALLAERTGVSKDIAADAQRYILCREMNFGYDTDFSMESCLRRYNTDLANDLGNLLNRSVNMVMRYLDGNAPERSSDTGTIARCAADVCKEYREAINDVRLNVALEAVCKLVGRMNKYIDETAPWSLAKGPQSDRGALCDVLYTCLEATRICTVLLSPFMPLAVKSIRRQLGITTEPIWHDTRWGVLEPGSAIGPPEPVFPRIQDLSVVGDDLVAAGVHTPTVPKAEKEATTKMEPLQAQDAVTAPRAGDPVPPETSAVAEPLISIDEFSKVQLRVGEVLAAEPVPGATKLLRLTVQAGEDDTRTILSGIAEYYQPEQLVGRQVVLITNLQPRKMRGIESQGMLLAADVDGRAILLQPDSTTPVGSRVR